MNNREILIANTKTQTRSKITTDATTLGELKTALNNAGIDYSGMTFTEGISKTQLLDDDTQLPQNLMYKGQPTNNLVILLTNTKKNIASGLSATDRKAAYSIIKDYGFQETIKEEFGRNYTQVPTSDLLSFIDKHIGSNTTTEEEPSDMQEDTEDTPKTDVSSKECSIISSVLAVVLSLVVNKIVGRGAIKCMIDGLEQILVKMYSETSESKSTPVSTTDGTITDDDIDNMLDNLNM